MMTFVVLVNCGLAGAHAQAAAPSAAPPTSAARDVSIDEYRQHLQALVPIVDACAKARDTKTCDPSLVGFDDRVPTSAGGQAGRRLISYDWLRALLLQAQQPDQSAEKPDATAQALPNLSGVRPAKPTTSQLLKDADARLARDQVAAGGNAGAMPAHSGERDVLLKVLAGREFRNLDEPSPRDTILEKIGNAINRFFYRVAGFGAKSRWIGRLRGTALGAVAARAALAHSPGARAERARGGSRLGARLATVARRRAPRRGRAQMARGCPLCLLGFDLAPRVQAPLARRPRAHAARISCPRGSRRFAPTGTGDSHRQL